MNLRVSKDLNLVISVTSVLHTYRNHWNEIDRCWLMVVVVVVVVVVEGDVCVFFRYLVSKSGR